MTLYKENEVVGEWEIITGGNETDPKKYGGTTPPLTWVMVEEIKHRTHPSSGSKFMFARIVPVGNKMDYHKRTFQIDQWPFMIHAAGSSTGCLAIKGDFSGAASLLNQAFRDCTFSIDVFDND